MESLAIDIFEQFATQLQRAGFVAANQEVAEMLVAANGSLDALRSMIKRRLTGEPIAWITGSTKFVDIDIHIEPDIYVPRGQSKAMVMLACELLPEDGTAIDVCTGSGAIAKVLKIHRPQASVFATDIDKKAALCALANGVDVYTGDLFEPLPPKLKADVIVGVVPYVPHEVMDMLPSDTFKFEETLAYDGGAEGLDILHRVVTEAKERLQPDGWLLLELAGDQAEALSNSFTSEGYINIEVMKDNEGDVRAIVAQLALTPTWRRL